MTNTEKPTGKAEQKKAGIVETPKQAKQEAPKTPTDKPKQKASDSELTDKPKEESKPEEKKEEPKKPIQKTPVVKKDEVVVNGKSLGISTKTSTAICRFIMKKEIGDAIRDLEQVKLKKKAVPMRGEIPHKKGKGMMSGRYPQKATESFIRLLKSLVGNANANDIETPIITEAIANKASRPYGRFGRWQRKRTHVTIKAKEKKESKSKKTEKEVKEKK